MDGPILVMGATGFVGQHLVPNLVGQGLSVRCASRHPFAASRANPRLPWIFADVTQRPSLLRAMRGCSAVVYLVHRMADATDLEQEERAAAEVVAQVAEESGVGRIVYLGGVAPETSPSEHLKSRLITGDVLRGGAVPTLELRAGMIVGAQSASWRIVRDLALRLPLMILPRWLKNRSQPVAIDDVIAAISHGLTAEVPYRGWYDIPGPDILTSTEILMTIAALQGSRPLAVSVPLVTPRLSSYWIGLVTRADLAVARQLVDGLTSDLIALGPTFWSEMGDHTRLTFKEAAALALAAEKGQLPLSPTLLEEVVRRVSRPAKQEMPQTPQTATPEKSH